MCYESLQSAVLDLIANGEGLVIDRAIRNKQALLYVEAHSRIVRNARKDLAYRASGE
eukprot:IDg17449t1